LTAVGSINRRRKSKQRQPAAVADIHPITRGHYGARSSRADRETTGEYAHAALTLTGSSFPSLPLAHRQRRAVLLL